MRRLRRLTLAPLAGLLGLVVGCNPLDFDDQRGLAPTVSLRPPADYPRERFGAVLTGYADPSGDESRLVATAGSDSPFIGFPVVQDEAFAIGQALFDGCREEGDCGDGSGASVAGLPTFQGRELCVMSVAELAGTARIECEGEPAGTTVTASGGIAFGASAASAPDGFPLVQALIGAPEADGGVGSVWTQPDGDNPLRLDLAAAVGVEGLGRSLAAARLDADRILVAAGAPDGDDPTVVVFTVEEDAGAPVTAVRACIDGPDGFGTTLALGDLDGDGVPDLAVGSGADGEVLVYDGRGLPDPGGCGPWGSSPLSRSCPEDADPLVECDDSVFGVSVAIGDVNADGLAELVVGAPGAQATNVEGAGAVFVFSGEDDLMDLGATTTALRHSQPRRDDNLGEAVTVVPGVPTTPPRVEVAAGAPGVDRVYVFTCTGLPDDRPEDLGGDRCQPIQ